MSTINSSQALNSIFPQKGVWHGDQVKNCIFHGLFHGFVTRKYLIVNKIGVCGKKSLDDAGTETNIDFCRNAQSRQFQSKNFVKPPFALLK